MKCYHYIPVRLQEIVFYPSPLLSTLCSFPSKIVDRADQHPRNCLVLGYGAKISEFGLYCKQLAGVVGGGFIRRFPFASLTFVLIEREEIKIKCKLVIAQKHLSQM